MAKSVLNSYCAVEDTAPDIAHRLTRDDILILLAWQAGEVSQFQAARALGLEYDDVEAVKTALVSKGTQMSRVRAKERIRAYLEASPDTQERGNPHGGFHEQRTD